MDETYVFMCAIIDEKPIMNIVFVFHFCSTTINDIASVPVWLGSKGHRVLVISSMHNNSLKGDVVAPRSEEIGGTRFYRPFAEARDLRRWFVPQFKDVYKEVAHFGPDVIVQFGEFNYPLPLKLKKIFGVPVVLFTEYLRLDKFGLPFRGKGIIQRVAPFFAKELARVFQRWLAIRSSAIMFSYYGDRSLIPEIELYCPVVRYVPWCTETYEQPVQEKRQRATGIYIGSLEAFKNAAELVEAMPVILDHTGTERFIVVGPGEFASHIRQLSEKYGSRLIYRESVPRPEAMRLLRSSGYGYTPVTDCGLGFIGDCWGTGTPLITTHELDGFLNKGVDTLIADNVYDLPRTINSLLSSDTLFERMQRGGRDRYTSNFTAQAVGEEYLKVLQQVLKSPRNTK